MTYFARCMLPLLLLIGGCSAQEPDQPIAEGVLPVMKTYQIDGSNARDIANVISALVQDVNARARTIGENLIVVSAPESLHGGIEDLIERLQKIPPDSAMRIRLHYWLVGGKPAQATTVPANLSAVKQALTEAQSTVGPMGYRRLDYIQQIVTSNQRHSEVNGDVLSVETQAAMNDGKIALDLSLRQTTRRVGAYVEMNSGETILLAQVGLTNEDDEVMMFLVRAESF